MHPLFGRRVMARSFRRIKGDLMLLVVLPDGSPGPVAAAATDVFGEEDDSVPGPATVLSVDGVRRLRALVEAKSRGSENRGTTRACYLGSASDIFAANDMWR